MGDLPESGQFLVVGGGTMGRGIARVLLEADWGVTVVEPDSGVRKQLVEDIRDGFEQAGSTTSIDRLSPTETIPDGSFWGGIEAVPEESELKQSVLAEMEPVVEKLLATNTSSIPIEELSNSLEEPERLVGLHFMNPVPVMEVVEFITREGTPKEVIREGRELLKQLGKEILPVRDHPGFVSNYLLMAMINRAVRLLEQNIAEKETIDRMMTGGMGHAMGLLEVADFIGLDVCRDTLEIIYERTDDPAYRPADSFDELIDSNHLGQKSGRGFYDYEPEEP